MDAGLFLVAMFQIPCYTEFVSVIYVQIDASLNSCVQESTRFLNGSSQYVRYHDSMVFLCASIYQISGYRTRTQIGIYLGDLSSQSSVLSHQMELMAIT